VHLAHDATAVPALEGVRHAPLGARSLPTPSADAPPDVWWARVESCATWAMPLAASVLDAEEREHAARLLHEVDRATYTVSHVVLRLLLARARPGLEPGGLAVDRAPCPSCSGPHGRPVLDGGPEFSLSHTRGAFAVAISPAVVGVDLEGPHRPAVVREVVDSLHPHERSEIASHRPEARPAAFARAWTRKESYLKAIGTGLTRDLAADDLGAGPSPRSPGPGWAVADLLLPPPFTGAVTWRSPSGEGL
jgi:4'-phosphopantetheinyl transferase